MLKIDEIKIFEDLSEEEVIARALKKSRIKNEDVLNVDIIKKSIDARDKNNVHYSYSLNVEVKDETKYPKFKKVTPLTETITVNRTSKYRPIIIGAGPCGLFCALTLIENGIKPIIIEQGDKVEDRIEAVKTYQSTGKLNPLSNVQFGEGGAGTFSDGKLNTGTNSVHITKVLQTFHKFGAPKEITYLNKPHIGTDNLVVVLKNMRNYITSLGGEYHFNTKFTNYTKEGNIITIYCGDKKFETDTVILAIGHSARDTFKLLKDKNIKLLRKNFSVGVRIEHLQEMINKSQYGDKTKLKLPAAEYKLVCHTSNGRTCYSFCMCPGGQVMASSSEEDGIVTNGMSYFARDGKNANAALLVNITPDDFKDEQDILAGMYFQRELEKAAYKLAGSNGNAPIQRVEDFHNNVVSTKIGKVKPTYTPGVTLSNLNEILPEYVAKSLDEALPYFDKKIKGFNDPDAILTGVETRSSSPITIVRNEELMMSEEGFYPAGEGAGYAGGITTAAVDGIKVAIKILEKH